MKKREVLFGILFLVFIFAAFPISADNSTDLTAVSDAYTCLNNNIDEIGCSDLSLTEKIFSVLSTGKCKTELLAESQDDECWPDGRCDVKLTSQAAFALSERGTNVDKVKEWLMGLKTVPSNLIWYLQIESEEATTCDVSYLGNTYSVGIGEDKKINSPAGSCLSLGPGGYWLEINSNCLDEEYEVTCDKSFLTNMLFRDFDSSTIQVLDVTHSASEYGTTVEQIDSFCLSTGASCDYEGNSWAAITLDKLGEDVSSMIPYLITSQEREFFPEPFLYMLTGFNEYRISTLEKQINEQYWRISNDRFYDTALALLPFQSEEPTEKTFTKDWLFEIQEEDGCWDSGNIRSNSFILYSLWPRASIHDDDGNSFDNSCQESGYFCMIGANCEGEILPNYNCAGTSVCCTVEYEEQTCDEAGGEVCSYNEYCTGDESYTAGESCCFYGECLPNQPTPTTENECEQNFGVCESFGCGDGYEEESLYSCDYSGDSCCMPSKKEGFPWWIWIMFGLIILVVIAIIYRDKLKIFMMKHSGGNNPSPVQRRPRVPPTYDRLAGSRPPRRRVVPQERPRRAASPRQKTPQELDDVLKKLKDMSN